jgi:hypothetical protein
MVWTLGGKQVGKAALTGWEYLSAVSAHNVRYWPFDGPLTALLDGDPNTVVVTETYPREFYRYFRHGTAGRGSKTEQEDRLRWAPVLFGWADTLGVTWRPEILQRVEIGFSDDINGEDEFDAVVGLLGMIAVVTGALESGEPRDDLAVLSVEGWILGRASDPAHATSDGSQGSFRLLEPTPGLSDGKRRATIEESTAELLALARKLGYSGDDSLSFLRLLMEGKW